MRNLIAKDTGASGDLGFDGDHAETFITARQTESIERLVKVVDVRALAQEQNAVTNAEFLGVLLYAWPVWTVTNGTRASCLVSEEGARRERRQGKPDSSAA